MINYNKLHSQIIRLLFIIFTIFISFGLHAEINIYVAPNADPELYFDANKNKIISIENAFQSLKKSSIRDSDGNPIDSINIHIAAGTYRLDESLVLDTLSSGSKIYPITITGPQEGVATLTGGKSVSGFSKIIDRNILSKLSTAAQEAVRVTNLPLQGITNFGMLNRLGLGGSENTTPLELFFDGKRMQVARWPNSDYARIATVPSGERGNKFSIHNAPFSKWTDEKTIQTFSYWFYDWSDETIPVESIDEKTGILTLPSPGHGYGIKVGQRIYIQNALSELDQPGEWYLDRDNGNLYFWPPGDLSLSKVEVSTMDKVLSIDGSKYIKISNLTIEQVRGDAIDIKNGLEIHLSDLHIKNTGKRAVVFMGLNSGIRDSILEDMGAGGVLLTGGDRQTLTPANLYVERTKIVRFGQIARSYRPAIRIEGVGNRAVSNLISEGPHVAVLFKGNDHLISSNEISNVCYETGDSGAIYTGRNWSERGTKIVNNYIHTIQQNIKYGITRGIYLDDYSSETTVEGNILQDMHDGVFINGGSDNIITGNYFINVKRFVSLSIPHGGWNRVSSEVKEYMLNTLNAVPYTSAAYSNKSKNLKNILIDNIGEPSSNLVTNNYIFGKSDIYIHPNALRGISVFGNIEQSRK